MILSDEDRIDINEYEKNTKFLENLSSSISVVICSISYKEKSGFYWRPNQKFLEIDIHATALLLILFPHTCQAIFLMLTILAI